MTDPPIGKTEPVATPVPGCGRKDPACIEVAKADPPTAPIGKTEPPATAPGIGRAEPTGAPTIPGPVLKSAIPSPLTSIPTLAPVLKSAIPSPLTSIPTPAPVVGNAPGTTDPEAAPIIGTPTVLVAPKVLPTTGVPTPGKTDP